MSIRVEEHAKIFRWTVIKEIFPRLKTTRLWECKCECGLIKVVRQANLVTGRSKSCGCLQKESSTSHGLCKHPLYTVWWNMKQRCYNPNSLNFEYWGGKGIVICVDWLNSFITFKEWAENNGYTKGLSLDRKDSTKEYCPDNCRWVSYTTQSRNKAKEKGVSSKYIGVSYYNNHYYSEVTVDKIKHKLGKFKVELDAAICRDSFIVTHGLEHFTLNGVL